MPTFALPRMGRRGFTILRVVCLGLYLLAVARYFRPGLGFTELIMFPESGHSYEVPAVRETPHFDDPSSGGYDGQCYAQLAVIPLLTDPAIDRAMDQPVYRARRILFSWTAYMLGLGRPRWILEAYALQNVACWLLLAWWLARRLRGAESQIFAVWFASLFCHGMLISTRYALLDGPALLLVALGVELVERKKTSWGAGLLGVCGLGRETSLLAGVALLERPRSLQQAMRLAGHGALLILPLLLWLDYLRSIYRSSVWTGADQVTAPFLGFLSKWQITASQGATSAWGSPESHALLALVGATVQAVALVAWADWRSRWWRVGAVFLALMLVADPVVWEGYPGAYTRVLLPMTLAFNLLLPGRKWFWPLLVLGNLSVIPGIEALRIPLVWRLF